MTHQSNENFSLESFHENWKKKNDQKKNNVPPSKEYVDYIQKLKEDPTHTPSSEEIFYSIVNKLNRHANGGQFIPTEKQSQLMNLLYQYFMNMESQLDKTKGVCMFGSFGAGKTEIMRAFTLTHFKPFNPTMYAKPCLVTSSIEMVDHYNKETNFDKYFENHLYIDDFGSEQRAKFMTKDAEPILSKFLELWYMRRNKRLYLTSNLNKQELKDKYGGRVFSRLHQLCNFIELNEKDFRI